MKKKWLKVPELAKDISIDLTGGVNSKKDKPPKDGTNTCMLSV